MDKSETYIQIIHLPSKEEPFLILNKSANLASAPLYEGDKNSAFYFAAKAFPELLNIKGRKECEHGLLHRLDTRTEGLLLIASSQEFYDFIQEEQKSGGFIKKYRAICSIDFNNAEKLEGYPPLRTGKKEIENAFEKNNDLLLSSYFRNYGQNLKAVRPVTEDSGKAALKKLGKKTEYTTEVKILNLNLDENKAICQCKIKAGYRHQVRCHLSWAGLPVKGDELYNFESHEKFMQGEKLEKLEFYACGLEFINPITNKKLSFEIPLNN